VLGNHLTCPPPTLGSAERPNPAVPAEPLERLLDLTSYLVTYSRHRVRSQPGRYPDHPIRPVRMRLDYPCSRRFPVRQR
jgi:hypothetical protein